MAEENNNQNLENDTSYIHDIEDAKASNPFSNALKSISNFLEKINLKKPEQARLGTKETNSRGFQTTSRNPLEATSNKSLKAILRTAFENAQNKRAKSRRANASPNKLQVHTVGGTQSFKQEQSVTNAPAKDVIRPLTASERAAQLMKANPPRNIVNNTVIMAEAKSAEAEIVEAPSAAEIKIDETFDQNPNRNLDQASDGINQTLETVNIEVDSTQSNQIIIPKAKTKEPKVAERNDDELSI